MTGAEPLVNVALAVVQRGDGRVLLAGRPRGKFNAVGKSEQALARKLHEKIGIKPACTYPWITCEYEYPNKRVRPQSFRVTVWHGAPHGCKGQRAAWEDPEAAMIAPVLPANAMVLEAPPDSAVREAMRDWLAREAGRGGANGNISVAIL